MKSSLIHSFIILILISATSIACYPQKRDGVSQEIYFMDYKSMKVKRIKQNYHIGYILASDSVYNTGVIKKISNDTIFMGKRWFTIKDVILIFRPNIIGPDDLDDPFSLRLGTIYKNDTARWTYMCPSKKAYASKSRMISEIHSLQREAKKENRLKFYVPVSNNYLQFNLARALSADLAASYEHKLSKLISLSIEAGYKFGAHTDAGSFDLYPLAQSGPTLIIGPKFYFHQKFYCTSLLHVKYLEIHDSYYKDPFSGDYPTLMDQFRTLAGISIRIGKMVYLGGSVWLDFFIGGGLKLAYSHQVSYNYYYQDETMYLNPEHTSVVSNGYNWLPLFSLGVKIGIGF